MMQPSEACFTMEKSHATSLFQVRLTFAAASDKDALPNLIMKSKGHGQTSLRPWRTPHNLTALCVLSCSERSMIVSHHIASVAGAERRSPTKEVI